MEFKNKINEQIRQKQTLRYRDQIDVHQMGGGMGEWAKNVEGD